MVLYKFELNTRKAEITVSEREVEEKPKIYVIKGNVFSMRVRKSDIGIASGYDKETVYLLENNVQKARDIFINMLNEKNESAKRRISDYENDICKTNELINALSEIKKVEE